MFRESHLGQKNPLCYGHINKSTIKVETLKIMFEKLKHRFIANREKHPNSVDYLVFFSAVAVFVYSFFFQGFTFEDGMVRYPLSIFVSGFVATMWFLCFIVKIDDSDDIFK